jgi:hypothetical protein
MTAMADHQSAVDVERQHLEAFGPEAGPLYHGLHNEVVWLHAKWLEYRKLFAKSDKRIELLNDTAGFFFKVVQDTLWENVFSKSPASQILRSSRGEAT